MTETVADLLHARADDDRIGLRFGDDAWTWREVVAECAARAAWIATIPAEKTSPHLGVLLDNVPEMVFLIGGAALSGGVIVALNGTRGPAELAEDVRRGDCDLIVTEERHAAAATSCGLPTWDCDTESYRRATAGAPRAGTIQRLTAQSLLMIIFTSGTSGRPHAVRVTHRKVVIPGENLAGRLLTPDDAVYCSMPLFHSGAVMAAFAPALAAGACVVLRRRFSASGLLPDVRRYGCTYLHYVGKALSYVLATDRGEDDAGNPLRVAFGNEAAPLEQREFAERFGCFVMDAYGSTETAISLSPDPAGPFGALGRLAEGIAILDQATGLPCPPAELDAAGRIRNGDEAVGELVNTAGRGLFDGYYGEPAPVDRYHSGDLCYADADGYVFFAGRTADRLRVDGENFGAAQVERVLAEYVRQVAVYPVPDVAAGDQVMAAMVADTFDPAAFGAFLGGRADFGAKWLPRYIRLTAELPATASNKILKRRLSREAWRTSDPVWWRPDRETAYRPMTDSDVEALAGEFTRRGRTDLLPKGTN